MAIPEPTQAEIEGHKKYEEKRKAMVKEVLKEWEEKKKNKSKKKGKK